MYKNTKKAFTLIELIVVITILAILGTIAFLSYQGYSRSARDAVRIFDIKSIGSSLELFQLSAGKYPDPQNNTPITFSGAEVRIQGIFGEDNLTNVGKLNKLPKDPLFDIEYTYSLLNTKKEFELGTILETQHDEFLTNNLLGETYAIQQVNVYNYIKGPYNGVEAKVSTGSLLYVLAIPSIINGAIIEYDIYDLLNNGLVSHNKNTIVPGSYNGIIDNSGEQGLIMNTGSLVAYAGNLDELNDLNDNSGRLEILVGLQEAYDGTILEDEDIIENIIGAGIIDTENPTQQQIILANTIADIVPGVNLPENIIYSDGTGDEGGEEGGDEGGEEEEIVYERSSTGTVGYVSSKPDFDLYSDLIEVTDFDNIQTSTGLTKIDGGRDVYELFLDAGTIYTLEILGDDNPDTVIYLYNNEGGNYLLMDDDTNGYMSLIEYTPTESGYYYLGVMGYGDDGTDYDYTLGISTITYNCDDTTAPTDNGHIDYITIASEEGQAYVQNAETCGYSCKSGYGGSDCSIVTSCDDTTAPTDNGNIDYVTGFPTTANQAYVKDALNCGYSCKEGYGGSDCSTEILYDKVSEGIMGYVSSYPDFALSIDVIELNNFSNIQESSNITGNAGARDVYEFVLEAGTLYTIETLGHDTESDTSIFLYNNEGGNNLAANDDIGGGIYRSKVTYTPTVSGYYYLGVMGRGDGAIGINYTLSITGIILSCDETTKPTDNGNIDYFTGTPSIEDQAYVQDATNCGYSCKTGYGGSDCSIELSCDETTAPTDNGHIDYITGTPTEGDQAYVQDASNCGYSCHTGYIGTDCSIELSCNEATKPADNGHINYVTGSPTEGNQTYVKFADNCGYSCTYGYGGSDCSILFEESSDGTEGTVSGYPNFNISSDLIQINDFDNINTSTNLTNNTGARDVYEMILEEGIFYEIEVLGNNINSDTEIYLYDKDGGDHIIMNDNIDEGDDIYRSRIKFLPTTSGYYYLGVMGDDDLGTNADYTISITETHLSAQTLACANNLTDGNMTEWGTIFSNVSSMEAEMYDPSLHKVELCLITDFNLNSYDLTSLPDSIGYLTNIESLDLAHNELTSLPTTIGSITNLNEITLAFNNLTSLPTTIGNLANLNELTLTSNDLTSLPTTIGNLTNLTILNVNENNLTSLPAEIGDLTNLDEFNLTWNNLTTLPTEIGDLSNLTLLRVENNSLSTISPNLTNLTNLSSLWIESNTGLGDLQENRSDSGNTGSCHVDSVLTGGGDITIYFNENTRKIVIITGNHCD